MFLSPTSRLWFPAAGPIFRAVSSPGAKKVDSGLRVCTKISCGQPGLGLAVQPKPLWPSWAVCPSCAHVQGQASRPGPFPQAPCRIWGWSLTQRWSERGVRTTIGGSCWEEKSWCHAGDSGTPLPVPPKHPRVSSLLSLVVWIWTPALDA